MEQFKSIEMYSKFGSIACLRFDLRKTIDVAHFERFAQFLIDRQQIVTHLVSAAAVFLHE